MSNITRIILHILCEFCLKTSSIDYLMKSSQYFSEKYQAIKCSIVIQFLQSMGYNSNCYYQDCYLGCCNIYGTCPSHSYDCAYYYHADAGTISGAVIGSVLGVILIVAIVCYCYRKKQQEQLMAQMAMNNHYHEQGTTIIIPGNNNPQQYGQPIPMQPMQQAYGQPYGQPPIGQLYGQPPMGQPFGQPPMGQPVYYG